MKLQVLFCAALACPLALVAGQSQARPVSTKPASEIPHLRKQGTATQLIVDGKPFLALAGELLNSSATSLEYMRPLWPEFAKAKLNTILPGVSWNQIEPQQGKFDFTVLDGVIQGARSRNMRLVLLWFGSWKNSLSGYAPDWVKKDFERFPRAQVTGGKSIELLSPFSDANRDADARAFAALMRHIKAVDGREHTVVMIQVENEVGMRGDSRDRSPMANQAFAGPVPKELMDYLQKHRDNLIPEFRQAWEAGGFKNVRNLGRGVRPKQGDRWNLHGMVLCALHRPGDRGWQSRVPDTDVRERSAVRAGEGTPTPAERWPALGPRDGRVEGRGAANRFPRARSSHRERLRGVLRQVHPIGEPVVHTRNERRAGKRGQNDLRLRTLRRHRLRAVCH